MHCSMTFYISTGASSGFGICGHPRASLLQILRDNLSFGGVKSYHGFSTE